MPAVPGFEPPVKGLCVAPFGMEEGTKAEIPPQEFMAGGRRAHAVFDFFASSVRRDDKPGQMLEDAPWERRVRRTRAPWETTLPAEAGNAGNLVPVNLQAAGDRIGHAGVALPRAWRQRSVEAGNERADEGWSELSRCAPNGMKISPHRASVQ